MADNFDSITRIAAYGTLRSHHENHVRSGMAEHVTSLGIHRISGRMWAVPNTGYAGDGGSDYPGAKFTTPGLSTIEVELFEITGDREALLALLDGFENDTPDAPEYERVIVNVDGQPAFIYEYLHPTDDMPEVVSGVWPNVKRYPHGHAALQYSADCSQWKCPACGRVGLDGEDNPTDFACVQR